MARSSTLAPTCLLAAAALALVAGCTQAPPSPQRPQRGDGAVQSVTVDESIRQWRAQRGAGPVRPAEPDVVAYPVIRGVPGRSAPGSPGTYTGVAPGLPAIPMRPDATTIPLPGQTTIPLPGGTTIPTPLDPLNPNPSTVTFPPLSR